MEKGCATPYQKPFGKFGKCKNKEEIKDAAYHYSTMRKMYPKACQRVTNIDITTKLIHSTTLLITLLILLCVDKCVPIYRHYILRIKHNTSYYIVSLDELALFCKRVFRRRVFVSSFNKINARLYLRHVMHFLEKCIHIVFSNNQNISKLSIQSTMLTVHT